MFQLVCNKYIHVFIYAYIYITIYYDFSMLLKILFYCLMLFQCNNDGIHQNRLVKP
jgi:hypothetical protein